MKKYLYNEIKQAIKSLELPEDTYVVGFLVTCNECNQYGDYYNLAALSVLYNTESECMDAKNEEMRWDYNYWMADEAHVIDYFDRDNKGKFIVEWLAKLGISDIGKEEEETDMYDCSGQYVGKGPKGYYEFLMLVSDVAKDLQNEGFMYSLLGKKIPIAIFDYEYSWYCIDATFNANPDGSAKEYLKFLKEVVGLEKV